MEFESARLIFKELSSADLMDIHQLHSCPEVDEFGTLGMPKDMDETKNRLDAMIKEQIAKSRKSYDWKLIERDSCKFIGLAGVSLSLNRFRLGEIYYELHPDFWGKGYGTEVAKQLIKTGFEHFQLHKLEAGVATENVSSIRILEKCGMTREGLRRKILPIRAE